MKTFLHYVAEDLYTKLHELEEDLTQTVIIFPNKRAGLFFNEEIARLAEGRPVWAPHYMTISELFSSLSPRKTGDSILLVCELYQEYLKLAGNEETLDNFYGWGEMIVSDFDDVDKNMADAALLFHNLDDLKDIEESISYLSEEQQEVIRQFFRHFKEQNQTPLKQHFRSFWNLLPDLYKNFNRRLEEEGIAYEGALYREVAERLNAEELPFRHYAFVGFNVLNAVEHALLTRIKEADKAWFYWDYDNYYLKDRNQEAGWFIEQDLKEFPNELPSELFNNLTQKKTITYVSAPTGNAQARYLPGWLATRLTEPEKETAIILCDETLLQPVLHSIPDNVKEMNVTMGFPLVNTPVYSLLTALLTLQEEGYEAQQDRFHYDAVANVLKHPCIQALSAASEPLLDELTLRNRFLPLRTELCRDDVLSEIFTQPASSITGRIDFLSGLLKQVAATFRPTGNKNGNMEGQLYRESLFNAYTTLERFRKLTEDKVLQITSPHTLSRLLTRVLSGLSIPFHGEPARGLQVMGVLETRNLDFRHLIILSVNEGNLPKSVNDNSLIPYSLRTAYNLTTIRHQVSVYAYYFYRLLQRAEDITLVYSEGNTGGLGKGEMSRFMLQYKLEGNQHIKEVTLSPPIKPEGHNEICVEKNKAMLRQLERTHCSTTQYFSPTALNCYLSCPLKFYFTYIGRMREEDEVSSVIDPRYFGTIFHRAAELLYSEAKGKTVTLEMLQNVVQTRAWEKYVSQAFNENFFQLQPGEKAAYNGEQLIKRDIIRLYMRQLIACDMEQAAQSPFKIIGLEENVAHLITLESTDKETYHISIGGKIDRRDSLLIDGKPHMRIVDYKTGGSPQSCRAVEQLFTPAPQRPDKIFQTFLYAYLAYRELDGTQLTPALFFVHKSSQKNYRPELEMNKELVVFEDYADEFESRLTGLLTEIFDTGKPFIQTDDTATCSYCPFAHLCRR